MNHLVPQDKFDRAAVARAAEVGWPGIEPVVDELLTWLQDMNWPVALPVVKLLAPVGRPLAEHVRPILRSDDSIWKMWVITHLLAYATSDLTLALRDELIQLTQHPSADDRAEEVDVVAQEALARLNG